MHDLAKFAIVLLLGCLPQAARAQSSAEPKSTPLPPARHGQPAFSFEGGKRVSVQKTTTSGMQEYGPGASAGGGTGIVELGAGGGQLPKGMNVMRAGAGTYSGTGIGTGIPMVPTSLGKITGKSALTSSSGKSSDAGESSKKKGTTVVQILGPDGKMEYKEVPFMGELSANKRAPNITEVKDGEGKVKEYGWAKKGQ